MPDVVIIGGGPAGATMGSYLSKAGIENIILEGAMHPRPHVGESLVTATTRIFDEIGFLDTMERAGFPRKYGAAWHPMSASGEFSIVFKEFPQPGVNQDYTYHVDRSKFDQLLLNHARELGSKVYQGIAAKEVVFEDGFASGVNFEVGGQPVCVPCKVVVDATGRRTLLGSQMRMKEKDPVFDQFAVHAWYEDVNRGVGESKDSIHIYFLPVERGWVWQIPINETVTSVGVVAEKNVFRESRKDVEAWFNTHIKSTPNLAEAMKGARRINAFKSEGDYSYSMERFAGNGFVLIGDAARFVDPIFSSGVSVATYSAKFAAERIVKAFEVGRFDESIFKPYEQRLKRGTNIWYEFIRLYYKVLPVFTYSIQSKDFRLQVLQLLQGEVYDRKDAPVLDEMRRFVETVENSKDHMFKGQLSDIAID